MKHQEYQLANIISSKLQVFYRAFQFLINFTAFICVLI